MRKKRKKGRKEKKKESEKKLAEVRKQGINHYAHKFEKKDFCSELQEKHRKLKKSS